MDAFALIKALADLVPAEDLSRLIVADAGLEPGLIAFDRRAWMNWKSIVGEARRQQRFDALIKAATDRYEEADHLVGLAKAFEAWAVAHPTLEKRLFIMADEAEVAALLGGVLEPGAWDVFRSRAEKHTRRFLEGHRSGSGGAATFDPALYVPREATEKELERFLAGTASAFILLGDSGVGKTNLFCTWASRLLDEGHAVLAYDCAALAEADVEAEVLRDLASPPDLAAAEAFERIGEEAGRAGRSVVIVFDSIGDYRGGEPNGVAVLLRRINALAQHGGPNLRVAVSCSTAVWSRMERIAPIRLGGDLYFRSVENEPVVRLGRFSPEELEKAYARYRDAFDLSSAFEELSPAVRERLRDPVLLRIVAETHRGAEQPLLGVNTGFGVYRRFFEERVQTDRERWLVNAIAAEMIRAGSAALSITDLAQHRDIGPEILNEDAASTYGRLLDRGILQEWRGNVRAGVLVKFTHTIVAGYALAVHLLEESPDVRASAAGLLDPKTKVPHAWEVAKTMLLESRDDAALAALARSSAPQERELAVEALVELHACDPKKGSQLLHALLDGEGEEGRRSALKAAYNIGPPAREFFIKAAVDGDASMRESVKSTLYLIWRNESAAGRRDVTDTAYLIWRHAPGFTHDLLNTLLGSLVLKNITKFPAILEFVLDLTITIYINHCEDEEVKKKTAALLHDLATARLHLDLFNTGFLGEKFEKLVFAAVARVFADQILKWMLFAETVPLETFFESSPESRAALDRIADVFDPASRLESAHDDLVAMLQSDVPIFAGSAAMAIGVHAAHDFPGTKPLIERLWDEVDAAGRLWILASFSILLSETPREWVPFLETLTRRYVSEHRDAFVGPASRLAGELDIVLLPLGLAYGKSGASMTVPAALLGDALAAGDTPMAARCVAALAAVGFHYPAAVFEVLRPVAKLKAPDETITSALVGTLATIRTLHFDAVDEFLQREEASQQMRRSIDAAADVTLVHRLIRVLGYYNNAVHFTLHYPRMRKPLSVGALKLLAKAKKPSEFVSDYTLTAMRMLRESKFQVMEWTLPE